MPPLALRETVATPLLLTASLMVPEIVPVLAHDVSANSCTMPTSSVSLSAVSVADKLASTKPLLVYVKSVSTRAK